MSARLGSNPARQVFLGDVAEQPLRASLFGLACLLLYRRVDATADLISPVAGDLARLLDGDRAVLADVAAPRVVRAGEATIKRKLCASLVGAHHQPRHLKVVPLVAGPQGADPLIGEIDAVGHHTPISSSALAIISSVVASKQ